MVLAFFILVASSSSSSTSSSSSSSSSGTPRSKASAFVRSGGSAEQILLMLHATRKFTKRFPVIKPLREMLDGYKAMTPGVGWIFTNAKGRPAWLDNLALREIRPVIEEAGIRWQGWHAFRRGLATNLYHMGISEAIVQRILRHEKGSVVTRKHYIQTDTPQAVVAMKQFEEQWDAIGRQLDDKRVN